MFSLPHSLSHSPPFSLSLTQLSLSLRLFKAGGGRVVGDYQKSLDYLTMVLVDDPDRTVIPNVLQNNTKVPLLRIKYIHELVLEVYYQTLCLL